MQFRHLYHVSLIFVPRVKKTFIATFSFRFQRCHIYVAIIVVQPDRFFWIDIPSKNIHGACPVIFIKTPFHYWLFLSTLHRSVYLTENDIKHRKVRDICFASAFQVIRSFSISIKVILTLPNRLIYFDHLHEVCSNESFI